MMTKRVEMAEWHMVIPVERDHTLGKSCRSTGSLEPLGGGKRGESTQWRRSEAP